jgi:hypothetical protein
MAEFSEIRQRVNQVLLDLQLISEAPAAAAPDAVRVHGGEGSGAPPRVDSLLDRHLGRLEEWLVRAEFDRDQHRFRAPAREPETPTEWAERVVTQYENVHDLDVAKREACSRTLVRKIRQRADREPLYGRVV